MALRAPPRCMKILFCEGAIFQIDQFGQLMDIIVFTEKTVKVLKSPLFSYRVLGFEFRVSSFEFLFAALIIFLFISSAFWISTGPIPPRIESTEHLQFFTLRHGCEI